MKYIDKNYQYTGSSGTITLTSWAGEGHSDTSYSIVLQSAVLGSSKPSGLTIGQADNCRGKVLAVAITVALTNTSTGHASVSSRLSSGGSEQTFVSNYTLSDSERNGGLDMISFTQYITIA